MISFKTRPHGEHEITIIEDAVNPLNRIYAIRQAGRVISILGSELTSIIAWFETEKKRVGVDE